MQNSNTKSNGSLPVRMRVVICNLYRLGKKRRLLGRLVAVLLVCAFIQICIEMVEGETLSFDTAVLRAAQSLRTDRPWVAEAMRDMSGLGSTTALTLLTVFSVGYLLVIRKPLTGLFAAVAVCTGSIGVSLLKTYFGRSRPEVRFAELVVSGMSFPSGHAANSTIAYLTIAALLASTRSRMVERTYLIAVASLIAVFVGLSRIALGVHWATDVLAGWAFGAAWAMAWLLLLRTALGLSKDAPI
jgi:undecaprenyl-diphosphatase